MLTARHSKATRSGSLLLIGLAASAFVISACTGGGSSAAPTSAAPVAGAGVSAPAASPSGVTSSPTSSAAGNGNDQVIAASTTTDAPKASSKTSAAITTHSAASATSAASSSAGAPSSSASAAGRTSSAPLTVHTNAFTLPSGNITCNDLGNLICHINQIDFKAPALGCSTAADAGHFIELSPARDTLICGGDLAKLDPGVVLQYGQTGITEHSTCISRESGLECTLNDDPSTGFVLNRSAVSWLPSVVSGPAPSSTTITKYTPWIGNKLASNIQSSASVTAECNVTSLVSFRGDSRRCFDTTSSNIYDPCFASADGTHAVCPSDGLNSVIEVKVSNPTKSTGATGLPFAVKLPNGEMCYAAHGTGLFVNKIATFFCTNGVVHVNEYQTTDAWVGSYSQTIPVLPGGDPTPVTLVQLWK